MKFHLNRWAAISPEKFNIDNIFLDKKKTTLFCTTNDSIVKGQIEIVLPKRFCWSGKLCQWCKILHSKRKLYFLLLNKIFFSFIHNKRNFSHFAWWSRKFFLKKKVVKCLVTWIFYVDFMVSSCPGLLCHMYQRKLNMDELEEDIKKAF